MVTPDGQVAMTFPGGQTASPMGRSQTPALVREYRGSDPARWTAAATTFEQVVYAGVWPGIDVVFHIAGTSLEHDFLVHAGADASRIRYHFTAAAGRVLSSDGSLRLQIGAGELLLTAPRIFEAGSGRELAGGYVSAGESELCQGLPPDRAEYCNSCAAIRALRRPIEGVGEGGRLREALAPDVLRNQGYFAC